MQHQKAESIQRSTLCMLVGQHSLLGFLLYFPSLIACPLPHLFVSTEHSTW